MAAGQPTFGISTKDDGTTLTIEMERGDTTIETTYDSTTMMTH